MRARRGSPTRLVLVATRDGGNVSDGYVISIAYIALPLTGPKTIFDQCCDVARVDEFGCGKVLQRAVKVIVPKRTTY